MSLKRVDMSEFDTQVDEETGDPKGPVVINRIQRNSLQPHFLGAIAKGFTTQEALKLAKVAQQVDSERIVVASREVFNRLMFHRWLREGRGGRKPSRLPNP